MQSAAEKNLEQKIETPPWPSIIISIFGGIVVIYSLIAPGVSYDRRLLGFMLIGLWTAMWILILWLMWVQYDHYVAWWVTLAPVTIIGMFFILILILDMGDTE